MAPTQKRKADNGPLSPNTKRARKKVVNELAEKVYAIQVLDSRHECSQMGGCGSKHGSIKTIVADAKKIYPWVDRTKIYNCLKNYQEAERQRPGKRRTKAPHKCWKKNVLLLWPSENHQEAALKALRLGRNKI
jgi:hypothetical protein